MIEHIILDIRHSDDYTDYLFQTVCLKSRRIVPLLDASEPELRGAARPGTLIFRCEGLYHDPFLQEPAVWICPRNGMIVVLREYYLRPDGTIDYTQAEMARQQIAKGLLEILEERQNIREIYRQHFGLLWRNRERIYEDPRLFFANTAISFRLAFVSWIPLGTMLRTIEQYPKYFSIPGSHCGHPCEGNMILTDFQYVKDYVSGAWEYELYLWCPECDRSFFRTIDGPDNWSLMSDLVEGVCKGYEGAPSLLTIFDVIDNLSVTR